MTWFDVKPRYAFSAVALRAAKEVALLGAARPSTTAVTCAAQAASAATFSAVQV
jgi:hypothetical protein